MRTYSGSQLGRQTGVSLGTTPNGFTLDRHRRDTSLTRGWRVFQGRCVPACSGVTSTWLRLDVVPLGETGLDSSSLANLIRCRTQLPTVLQCLRSIGARTVVCWSTRCSVQATWAVRSGGRLGNIRVLQCQIKVQFVLGKGGPTPDKLPTLDGQSLFNVGISLLASLKVEIVLAYLN